MKNRGQKDYKSQRLREFAGRMCLLVTLEAIPLKSHDHDCLSRSRTEDTNEHAKLDREKP